MIVATKAKPIARSFRRALRRLEQRWRRGLGAALVRAALDDARDRGFRVVPICPFVEAYVRRHPEDADLVVADPARSQ
ncbi:MAG TPA: GNAT family N-acetyltransferase [Gaiellaceae bacterium]|nr:GNAT family N-acetyltransferase [Gaiellaceae bacterium]